MTPGSRMFIGYAGKGGNDTHKGEWSQYFQYFIPGDNEGRYIYRGHSQADFNLEPSLFREGDRGKFGPRLTNFLLNDLEKFKEFFKLRKPEVTISQNWPLTSWIALAQHYKLKTPLLDWTSSPFVALLFAYAGADKIAKTKAKDKDRDPNSLEEPRVEPDELANHEKGSFMRIFRMDLLKKPNEVVVLEPPYGFENPRQKAQQGCFSYIAKEIRTDLSGVSEALSEFDEKTLEDIENTSEFLSYCDLRVSEGEPFIKGMRSMNITLQHLFPDSLDFASYEIGDRICRERVMF